jgi:hypothetical protein
MTATKYIIKKQCLNCFEINDPGLSHCKQCGFLFIGEATEAEKAEAMETLAKMREKAEKNVEE